MVREFQFLKSKMRLIERKLDGNDRSKDSSTSNTDASSISFPVGAPTLPLMSLDEVNDMDAYLMATQENYYAIVCSIDRAYMRWTVMYI